MPSSRPASCVGCTLHDSNQAIGFMTPEGDGSNGVLVLGDYLGEREANDSLPLRPKGPAGSVFEGIIRRIIGLRRDAFTISNTIWCRPGKSNWLDGAPYEFGAIQHCQKNNAKLVQQRRPKVILALGAIPTRTVTGLQGYNQGIKMIRGYVIPSARSEYFVDGKPIPVVGTYAPSFLLRASKTRSKGQETTGGKTEKAEGGMALSGVVMRDIELALHIAKHGVPQKRKFEVIHGDRNVMDNLIREAELNQQKAIAWDIETPRSIDMAADESEIDSIQANVNQIQFALDDQRGFVFPGFKAEYVKRGTARLLALRNRKYTWNGWKFDNRVVSGHHGIPILGEDIDLMSAWHWIQPDLPQGLQFATSFFAPELGPWKHYAAQGFEEDEENVAPWALEAHQKATKEMDYYGACDVISLHINAKGIFRAQESRGLYQSYDRHVIKLRTEMTDASHRGFPLDPEKHQAFGVKIYTRIGEVNDQIQTLIPDCLRNIEPKKKRKGTEITEYGYVRVPKQLVPFIDPSTGASLDGKPIVIEEQIPLTDEEDNEVEGEFDIKKTVYIQRLCDTITGPVLRWCRLNPFSVGSVDQKLAYIQYRHDEEVAVRMGKGQSKLDASRLAKHQIPMVKDKQKKLKPNSGAKELEKLAKITGDLVYTLLVEIGKLKKMHGTYVRGWQHKNKEGKWVSPEYVHTSFGLANTGTGQLSSVEPNIQNAPKHSSLGKEFRGCIVAKQGKRLWEFDKKAFHAQTLAFEAKDPVYARIAALDVHSFVTNIRLHLHTADEMLKMSDKDMKGLFIEQKGDDKHPGPIFKSEGCVAYPEGMTFQQVRDFKSKKVILGIGFCQGPGTIYEQNPEGYKDKKEVEVFLDIVKGLIPDVFTFQKMITNLAHKQTYLVSKWGYIRRFYDVFQWDASKWNPRTVSTGDWRQGDDYEAAVAFYPANDAFGMLKEEMLRLAGYRIPDPGAAPDPADLAAYELYKIGKLHWDEYLKMKKICNQQISENLLALYGFVNQIHDSLMFHCDTKYDDRIQEDVLKIMREPCITLSDSKMAPNGLFVDSDAQNGLDWAHMRSVT